ncbi:M67 family metallopeptidase [Sulfurivermis fontis]|uniref:M67 family metallopeptidase n=1 Tax=Sulfurivermis fontis TaxID=1972068 RepID=UPI000FDCA3AE|nr:M67 family metallopeptidase [Sulfurivermis fontis]
MPIHIARPLVNRILGQALCAPEQEICGLIGARDGTPQTVYPVANVAAERDRLFAMDPQQQIDAMRRMRENDETLFAIYHSHPHAPAVPSALDLAQAAYPEVLYLIVSLNTKGVLEMQGYRLRGRHMEPVELAMITD